MFGPATAESNNPPVGVGVVVTVFVVVAVGLGVGVRVFPPSKSVRAAKSWVMPEQLPWLCQRVGVFGGVQEIFDVCAVTHW